VDEKVVVSNAVSVATVLAATAETALVVIAVIALVAIAVIVLAAIEEEEEEGSKRREAHPENLLLHSEEKVVEEGVEDLAVVIANVSATDPVLEVETEVVTEVVIDPALAEVAEITEDPTHLRVSDEAALALLLVNKHFLSLFSSFENSRGGSVFVTPLLRL